MDAKPCRRRRDIQRLLSTIHARASRLNRCKPSRQEPGGACGVMTPWILQCGDGLTLEPA